MTLLRKKKSRKLRLNDSDLTRTERVTEQSSFFLSVKFLGCMSQEPSPPVAS